MKNKEKYVSSKWIHFIGIGGAGMSALAQLAINRGYKVTGSDINFSNKIKELRERGAVISLGHKRENILEGIGEVVYSTCIPEDNVELMKARKLNISISHRAEFLAQLMEGKHNIAICGSHGKTTTSSLIYHILHNSGYDVSAAIGGSSYNSYNNIERDTSYFVAEADESDGSFTNLSPNFVILTNLDKDHFDFYKNFSNMLEYFNRFLRSVQNSGWVFLNQEMQKYNSTLLKNVGANVGYFGLKKNIIKKNFIYPIDFDYNHNCIKSEINYPPYFKNETIQTNIVGTHNLKNILAAVALCIKLGISIKEIKQHLKTFKGVRRRFQVRLNNSNYKLVEDYAHHPTEIKATISTVKECYNFKRIIGIFQPHRYTRTKLLAKELGISLRAIDKLILTHIYSANESPIPGVNIENIYNHVENDSREVICLPKEKIVSYLMEGEIERKDLILVLGAGDIHTVAEELEEALIDK